MMLENSPCYGCPYHWHDEGMMWSRCHLDSDDYSQKAPCEYDEYDDSDEVDYPEFDEFEMEGIV